MVTVGDFDEYILREFVNILRKHHTKDFQQAVYYIISKLHTKTGEELVEIYKNIHKDIFESTNQSNNEKHFDYLKKYIHTAFLNKAIKMKDVKVIRGML